MNEKLHKIEVIVDKSIPYVVLLLLYIIITDFFFQDFYHKHEIFFIIGDYFVLGIFVADLIFKFNRVRKFNIFLKKYWLDIIAVFPFFLLFRVFEEVFTFFRLGRELTEGQKIVHSGLEIEKLAKEGRLLSELEQGSKVFSEGERLVRSEKLVRVVRPITRAPRILKAIPFYEKPIKKEFKKGKHLLEEEIKKIEKEL
ncbi:hypothetical protein CL617_00060 [archaeon]|nr:hypothetical protein [archaeon]|tara:strand:+ start:1319 stop:1912 length:594 start_codon:yes stop_codon:yes gene_type:complete